MKLKDVERLVKAAKAKSQIENLRLVVLRGAQNQLAAAARAYEMRGRQPLRGEEMTGADIAAYARHQSLQERFAQEKRREAAELEPLRLAQDGRLRQALQEEIAWERLEKDARLVARKERDAREEERREMLARKR